MYLMLFTHLKPIWGNNEKTITRLQFLKSTSLLLLRFWLEAVWTWLQTVDLWVIVTTVLRALLVASDLQALLSNRESMGCCACLSSRTQITGVHPSLMHCCFSPISFSALLEYKTKITVRKKPCNQRVQMKMMTVFRETCPKLKAMANFGSETAMRNTCWKQFNWRNDILDRLIHG